MATRKKNNRNSDETIVNIVDASEGAQDFFEKNQTLITSIIVGLVVIVGGWFAYTNLYLEPRNEEAVEQMFQAQFQFEQDSFALALTNPGAGYGGFLDIIDNYSGTKSANISKYYAGISYLNLGEFDAAIDYLEDYKPSGSITPIMKYGALGDAYSELGDYDKALAMYKKASGAEDNNVLTPYYLKKWGMLLEYQSKPGEALTVYKRIKAEYPQAPDATNIDKYIIRAEAK
jgi:tetratricopeptide (TPR) repeat protein